MKIALVDDKVIFLEYFNKLLTNELDNCKIKYEISVFNNPNEFISALENTEYDYVFLDIEMPETDGFNVASKIKNTRVNTEIVFISNHENFVFDSFDFSPLMFIRKQLASEDLKRAVKKMENDTNQKNKYILALVGGEHKKIFVQDILYFEHHNHTLTLHTASYKINSRDNIRAKEEELQNYGFVRIHIGYLVNLKHIEKIEGHQLILDNSTKLPISRRRLKELKEKYLKYLMKTM